ncbi:MAG: helix-turn-helix domain-containing protein [Spirochaetales bacterium]|nr:helix-turn-helix domain-containing protein [Spirochaetales bacterium]
MKEILKTIETIDYIEENITERLELGKISRAVNLSPFYLHRTFSKTTGTTINSYLRRRQLTEAARMLSFSDRPIMDIALLTGYETQQSFSRIFKSMYKHTPNSFRKRRIFYPLQQRFDFSAPTGVLNTQNSNTSFKLKPAQKEDIPKWMELTRLVVDGFPFLDEEEHIQTVKKYIEKNQALIVKDKNTIAGGILFSYASGSIDFFAIHPLYKKSGLFNLVLSKLLYEVFDKKESVSITTYRDGDKADNGYRKALKNFGFIESELLTEFGYPTQKLTFYKNA